MHTIAEQDPTETPTRPVQPVAVATYVLASRIDRLVEEAVEIIAPDEINLTALGERLSEIRGLCAQVWR